MKFFYAATILLANCALASSACASVYSDDLGKCLVAKSSDEDKVGLMQWVFASLSASPAVEDMSKATPSQHDIHDRFMAKVFDRLMLVDCRQQSIAALKYDGVASVKEAFGLLGQVAMQSLTGDPAVNESMGRFVQYIDKEKLAALMQEGGIKVAEQPGKPAR